MVNDQNPGNRLRSVNAFASQMQNLRLPDREVKAALISTLRSDDNPGVRREAIRTLQHFPFDDEIKQVFLHVLMKDPNPALRMAAINSLDSARTQGQAAGSDLLDVLKQRMQSDENTYVRIRAKAVLEEVRNQ
jgi:HEAT repeat protein